MAAKSPKLQYKDLDVNEMARTSDFSHRDTLVYTDAANDNDFVQWTFWFVLDMHCRWLHIWGHG